MKRSQTWATRRSSAVAPWFSQAEFDENEPDDVIKAAWRPRFLPLLLGTMLSISNLNGADAREPDALQRELPVFIDPASIQDAEFECKDGPVQYDAEGQQHLDELWTQTLRFLEGYAVSLTTQGNGSCLQSALAMRETNTPAMTGPSYECIMDNRDVQLVVKHIYAVLENPDKAKACFAAREDVDWMFTPSVGMENSSEVAQYFERTTLEEYYEAKEDPALRAAGRNYAKHFRQFMTNDSIQMPGNFPFDISAKSLPDLWAAAGWVPMYSYDDPRSLAVGSARTRGGYAYAEVFGHWGLLRIKKINDEPVGAEIGMTAQIMGTFYPYHHHATHEIYYTIREPECVNSVRNFVMTPSNGALADISADQQSRVVAINGNAIPNIHKYWSQSTPSLDPLLYIPANTIHAFDLTHHCEANPDETAHVTIWARTNADVAVNDYGTTLLCELKDETLPKDAANSIYAHVLCKLNHFKY